MTAINQSEGRGPALIQESALKRFLSHCSIRIKPYTECAWHQTPFLISRKYKPLTLLVLQGSGDGYNTNFRSGVVVKSERFSTFMLLKRAELMTGTASEGKRCAIKFRRRRSSNWRDTFSGKMGRDAKETHLKSQVIPTHIRVLIK